MNYQGPPIIDYGPYKTAQDASQHFLNYFGWIDPKIKFPLGSRGNGQDMESVFRAWWPEKKAKFPADITENVVWAEIQKQMSQWPFSIK